MASNILSSLAMELAQEMAAKRAEELTRKIVEQQKQELAEQTSALQSKIAALEAQVREQELRQSGLAALETQVRGQELQRILADILIRRFPQSPMGLLDSIYRIRQADRLHNLIVETAATSDVQDVERLLKQAAEAN